MCEHWAAGGKNEDWNHHVPAPCRCSQMKGICGHCMSPAHKASSNHPSKVNPQFHSGSERPAPSTGSRDGPSGCRIFRRRAKHRISRCMCPSQTPEATLPQIQPTHPQLTYRPIHTPTSELTHSDRPSQSAPGQHNAQGAQACAESQQLLAETWRSAGRSVMASVEEAWMGCARCLEGREQWV